MIPPANVHRATRRPWRGAWPVAVTAALVACGGGTTKPVTTPAPAAAAPGPSGSRATVESASGALGGHSMATYTCDSLPAADLLAAIQTVAPKTTAGTTKTETASTRFDPLVCDYTFAPNLEPGLDPNFATTATFQVKLDDKIIDGAPAYSYIKQGFEKNRDRVIADVKGDAAADIQSLEFAAPGLGVEAFFDDYITRTAGIDNGVRSDLSILRETLPVDVQVKLSYSPQPDSSVAVPALADDPFQNETRHKIVEAVAKAVLAKLS